LGGFLSLAFDGANRPTVSYYDSLNSALKFARSSGDTFTGIRFAASFVATEGLVGYYSNLYYDAVGKANILYFDRTNNRAMRARNSSGSTWTITTLGAGGRELHSAFFAGRVAFTNLNEDAGSLEVVY
jgi:hypothetical protein